MFRSCLKCCLISGIDLLRCPESHVEIEETDVFIYLFILKENVCLYCTSFITFFFKHAQFDLEV